jgi:hypothetical protein
MRMRKVESSQENSDEDKEEKPPKRRRSKRLQKKRRKLKSARAPEEEIIGKKFKEGGRLKRLKKIGKPKFARAPEESEEEIIGKKLNKRRRLKKLGEKGRRSKRLEKKRMELKFARAPEESEEEIIGKKLDDQAQTAEKPPEKRVGIFGSNPLDDYSDDSIMRHIILTKLQGCIDQKYLEDHDDQLINDTMENIAIIMSENKVDSINDLKALQHLVSLAIEMLPQDPRINEEEPLENDRKIEFRTNEQKLRINEEEPLEEDYDKKTKNTGVLDKYIQEIYKKAIKNQMTEYKGSFEPAVQLRKVMTPFAGILSPEEFKKKMEETYNKLFCEYENKQKEPGQLEKDLKNLKHNVDYLSNFLKNIDEEENPWETTALLTVMRGKFEPILGKNFPNYIVREMHNVKKGYNHNITFDTSDDDNDKETQTQTQTQTLPKSDKETQTPSNQ